MSERPKAKDRTAPLSVRFTDAEKQRLRDLAGARPLGLFIRERALEGEVKPRRARQAPVKDADALGRLLGLLGQSRLASNLNQLAKAANQGSPAGHAGDGIRPASGLRRGARDAPSGAESE